MRARLVSAAKAYLAALILALPLGACLELSTRAPGGQPVEPHSWPVGCGWSSEDCEMFP